MRRPWSAWWADRLQRVKDFSKVFFPAGVFACCAWAYGEQVWGPLLLALGVLALGLVVSELLGWAVGVLDDRSKKVGENAPPND